MNKETELLQFLHYHPQASRQEIEAGMDGNQSAATVKRLLKNAINTGHALSQGRGPATRYRLTPQAQLLMPLNIDTYFEKEIDEREVQRTFNFQLIRDTLPEVRLFNDDEMRQLNAAQSQFREALTQMTDCEYRKEMERLGIDLSWKSSQIEGNTYTLLETERLLKEKQTAAGRTKEEAIMLLNHKDALDFLLDVPDYVEQLTVAKIEQLHDILTKELGVDRGIRHRRVGITGTNYMPPDNEFQLREAVEDTCQLVNSKNNVFEKALLALVLLSYIQAFSDGNKRTARIVSNALLIAHGHCPLSFRTTNSIDYKKAMLIFYEQNNIAAFKAIFIDQFLFATRNYF